MNVWLCLLMGPGSRIVLACTGRTWLDWIVRTDWTAISTRASHHILHTHTRTTHHSLRPAVQVHKKGKCRLLQGPFCAAKDEPICLEDCLVVGLWHDEDGAKAKGWCEKEMDAVNACYCGAPSKILSA